MNADGLLSIRECADRLGMTESQLRELARKGKLPASKHAGRWLVARQALDDFHPARKLTPATKARARVAEGVALDDMTHQLLGRGTVVSEPAARRRLSPEAAAEAAALRHQLHPTEADGGSLPLPTGLKGRARGAQREALEHLQERLDKPHPPERSL
jgi:excisionase family DNA binding protein